MRTAILSSWRLLLTELSRSIRLLLPQFRDIHRLKASPQSLVWSLVVIGVYVYGLSHCQRPGHHGIEAIAAVVAIADTVQVVGIWIAGFHCVGLGLQAVRKVRELLNQGAGFEHTERELAAVLAGEVNGFGFPAVFVIAIIGAEIRE